MDVDRLRSETPGCAERIHLNNAGASLMPRPVLDAVQEHLELESRIGGYEAAEVRHDAITAAYGALAELLGAKPRNVALTESSTASTMQALSSIPFEPGDVLLTSNDDYVSNQIQFLALGKRFGTRLVRAPDLPEGGVDPAAVGELVRRHRPRLVCLTHVPTNSGLVQDVAAVGRVCREADVLYLVDACQSIGQIPLDVEEIGCDFLAASARKFLRGPRGAGVLWVSDRVLERGLEPLLIDMRGADWVAADRYRPADGARRFETWDFPWALVLGTGEAVRYALALGLPAIERRVTALAGRLRDGLAAIDSLRVLDRGARLCGLVTVSIDGCDPAEAVVALRRRRINASSQPRENATIDYDRKGVAGAVRLSPHAFNTEEEIDEAIAAVRELVSS